MRKRKFIGIISMGILLLILAGCSTPSSSKNTHNEKPSLFPVKVYGKWGFINKNGNIVIQPQYENEYSPNFSEDLTAVKLNGKWGYADARGSLVIKPQYQYADDFSEGLAIVEDNNHHWKYIKPNGDIFYELEGTFIGLQPLGSFHEGFAGVRIGEKWGFINKKGSVVIKPQFNNDYSPAFSEGLSLVAIQNSNFEKSWGYINTSGKLVIPASFNKAERFNEGLAAVKVKDKYGFINKTGKMVIPARYDEVMYFNEGLAAVKVKDKYGFIDKTGKMIIQPEYDGAFAFFYGLCNVEMGGKYGVINKNGQMVIQPKYSIAWPVSSDLIEVYTGYINDGEDNSYIDLTGKVVWPHEDQK